MTVLRFYLLRFLTFIIPFVVYCLLGLGLIFSTVFATVTGLCLSYLFLNKQRRQASHSIAGYMAEPRSVPHSVGELEDNAYEDAAVDEASPGKPSAI